MAWHHTTGPNIHVHVPKPAMPKAPKPVTQKQAAPAAHKPVKAAGPKPMTPKGKTAVYTEKHRPHMSAVSKPKGIRH